jgi:hypothetical protein
MVHLTLLHYITDYIILKLHMFKDFKPLLIMHSKKSRNKYERLDYALDYSYLLTIPLMR